jgi:hypothetical protein
MTRFAKYFEGSGAAELKSLILLVIECDNLIEKSILEGSSNCRVSAPWRECVGRLCRSLSKVSFATGSQVTLRSMRL